TTFEPRLGLTRWTRASFRQRSRAYKRCARLHRMCRSGPGPICRWTSRKMPGATITCTSFLGNTATSRISCRTQRMASQAAKASMPTLGAGSSRRGITLIEMVIVMAIVGLIAGITYPTVSNGLDSVHLAAATDTVAAFLNAAVNRVERRQEVVEL